LPGLQHISSYTVYMKSEQLIVGFNQYDKLGKKQGVLVYSNFDVENIADVEIEYPTRDIALRD